MNSIYKKGFELFLLFIALPLSFLFNYPIYFKVGFTLIGFIYVLVYLNKNQLLRLKLKDHIDWKSFWRETLIKLSIIVLITSLCVFFYAPDKLFFVMLQKPELWIFILFIYTLLSVWPQEIIYRTFFYHRYESLVSNKWLFIFINAILFSLAHIFFRNTLVQILTILGGLLFAFTYQKTRSTTLVSIEHALYGNWLFTVGMGEMLAFPSVD